MANDRRKLRLPGSVTMSTLSIALALVGAGCGDDDSGPADAAPPRDAVVIDAPARDAPGPTDGAIVDAFIPKEVYFCIYDSNLDSGGPFDAATCNGTVTNPDDCPGGCRAVG